MGVLELIVTWGGGAAAAGVVVLTVAAALRGPRPAATGRHRRRKATAEITGVGTAPDTGVRAQTRQSPRSTTRVQGPPNWDWGGDFRE